MPATRTQPEERPTVESFEIQTEIEMPDAGALEPRWAFQAALRDKPLDYFRTKYTKAPFARFFAVAPFRIPREHHSIDFTQPKEYSHQVTAAAAEKALNWALGDGDSTTATNWGIQFGFVGTRDAAQMEVINHVLMPKLSMIREIAAKYDMKSPIPEVCPATDDLDFGPREECVTCWFQWLQSDLCKQHMKWSAAHGLGVSERNPSTDEVVSKTVWVPLEEFQKAHDIMMRSMRLGIRALQDQWAVIVREIEDVNAKRRDIGPDEHVFRKDLHQNNPKDTQFAMIREFAKAGGGGNSGNDDVLRMLAESQMQTNQLLAQLAAGNMAVPAPAQEEPVAEEPVAEEPVAEAVAEDVKLEAMPSIPDLDPEWIMGPENTEDEDQEE